MAKRKLVGCIYCGKPAGTKEHIIATRFVDVLEQDQRGFKVPTTLYVTPVGGGSRREIGGRRVKSRTGKPRRYTIEYTTRVCDRCNSGWMNDVDTAVYPSVAQMIRGNTVTLDRAGQANIAAWAAKVAVTARSEPHNPLPIEPAWTDWLFTRHTAPPNWHVWISHYVGSEPFWYNPDDVRIELGQGTAALPWAIRPCRGRARPLSAFSGVSRRGVARRARSCQHRI